MFDHSFQPERLEVRPGEVIRFVVHNKGEFLHEFAIGTAAMHAGHQKEMAMMEEHGLLTPVSINHDAMQHGGMAQDDPNSVLVEPGKTAELVWKFGPSPDLEFAYNVPGHYESGMVGPVTFRRLGA